MSNKVNESRPLMNVPVSFKNCELLQTEYFDVCMAENLQTNAHISEFNMKYYGNNEFKDNGSNVTPVLLMLCKLKLLLAIFEYRGSDRGSKRVGLEEKGHFKIASIR